MQFQRYWIMPLCEAGCLVVAAERGECGMNISMEFEMRWAVSSWAVPDWQVHPTGKQLELLKV